MASSEIDKCNRPTLAQQFFVGSTVRWYNGVNTAEIRCWAPTRSGEAIRRGEKEIAVSQPMAHVFIVNGNTFPVHLEYQFAGTTAGLNRQRYTPLYADIARVRPGHRAYFYLLGQGFYDPFKIDPDGNGAWWDGYNPAYLQGRLKLRLIYRVKVVADEVYPLGISEWNALDEYLRKPELCLWSLVYRKLKGERGCTMVFPWEDDFLLMLIQERNESKGRQPLRLGENEHLTWNAERAEIVVAPGPFSSYKPPRPDHLSPPEDPLDRVRLASGSETHLQAFLTRNYGRFPDSELIFGPTETISWVGNEVACGLGMQKMDLFAINEERDGTKYRIIELKRDPPDGQTVWQLQRYIKWTREFIPGADSSNIQPVLVCRNLKHSPLSSQAAVSFRKFDAARSALSLVYIECTRDPNSSGVRFRRIDQGVSHTR